MPVLGVERNMWIRPQHKVVSRILRLILSIMSDEEQAQWPAWKRAVYQVDYSESGYPSVTNRLRAASVKNNRGGTSYCSWESPNERQAKRFRSQPICRKEYKLKPQKPLMLTKTANSIRYSVFFIFSFAGRSFGWPLKKGILKPF